MNRRDFVTGLSVVAGLVPVRQALAMAEHRVSSSTPATIKADALQTASLDPDFTFASFVAGETNEQALSIALHVANHPHSALAPFWIHGDCGHGKTHLLHAIGHRILDRDPRARVCYVHSHNFMLEVVQSYRDRKLDDFRHRYAGLDALLIDDVSVLNCKPHSQAELLRALDRLTERGKLIVMADERRLEDWFGNAGMVAVDRRLLSSMTKYRPVRLGSAGLELRMNILRDKAQRQGLALSEEILRHVAESEPYGNILALENALRRTLAFARFHEQDVSIGLVRRALAGLS